MSHEMDDEMNASLEALDEHLTLKEKSGRVVLKLALLATVYYEDPYKREVREAVASCCEDYFQRCSGHLCWAYNPDTELVERFAGGKGSNPRAWLPERGEDENFAVLYHGAQHDFGASAISLIAYGAERRPYPTRVSPFRQRVAAQISREGAPELGVSSSTRNH